MLSRATAILVSFLAAIGFVVSNYSFFIPWTGYKSSKQGTIGKVRLENIERRFGKETLCLAQTCTVGNWVIPYMWTKFNNLEKTKGKIHVYGCCFSYTAIENAILSLSSYK